MYRVKPGYIQGPTLCSCYCVWPHPLNQDNPSLATPCTWTITLVVLPSCCLSWTLLRASGVVDFSKSKTSRRRRLLDVEDFSKSKTSPSRSRRLLEGHLLTGVGDTKPPPATTLPARNTTIALLLTLKKTSRKSTLITRRIMIEFILVFRQTAVYAYTKKNHIGFILVTRIKALSKQL